MCNTVKKFIPPVFSLNKLTIIKDNEIFNSIRNILARGMIEAESRSKRMTVHGREQTSLWVF